MTALAQYELLEAEGRYADGQTAGARDVIVKFGDASLIVLDHSDMPITHWPLATLRNIAGGGAALSLIPDHGSDERLTIEDEEMIAAIRAVCPDLERARPVPRGRWRRVGLWAAGALGSAYLIIFHLVPALSDQMALLIPPEAEIAMGETMVEQFADFLTEDDEQTFCTAPEGSRALARMTARLAPSAASHVPLKVRVLDHDMVNAFALPGGQVVLFRGLLDIANSPEEIAGVLAHEVGHVVNRDPTRLTLRTAGTAGLIGVLLGDFSGAGAVVILSETLLTTGYQRQAEAAADVFATDLLSNEGLPTTPFADFFLKLKEKEDGRFTLPSHLASHPDTEARARAAKAADQVGGNAFIPVLTDQEWVALQEICG